MSRSRRHTPIFGIASLESEKTDKQLAHRAQRAAERVAIAGERLDDMPLPRETSNTWSFRKDGRSYWAEAPVEYMRK